MRSPGASGGGGGRLLAVHALDGLQDGGSRSAPPLAGRDGVLVRLRLGHPQLCRGDLGRRLLQQGGLVSACSVRMVQVIRNQNPLQCHDNPAPGRLRLIARCTQRAEG